MIKDTARKPLAGLIVGIALAASVGNYEGFSSTPYHATPEESFLTLGYGSTRHSDGTPIKSTDRITREEAAKLMQGELEGYKKLMLKCVKVPLYQYEFEAYASLTYNIGPTNFCNSTLVKKLNQQDYSGACKEILKWDKQKGKVLKGLTARRQDEYLTCIGSKGESK